MDSALISGASGLLGSEVVKQLTKIGVYVFGQYYKNKPPDLQNCKWIYGDFKSQKSLKHFLQKNKKIIESCKYFINCYGPITYKNIKDLKTEHFEEEFFSNVLVPIEIINFFLSMEKTNLISVVNIGFELSGKIKPVKNILPYLMAKNALLQYSISLAEMYKNINFKMVSPSTLEGAQFPSKNGKTVSPGSVAKTIIETLLGSSTRTSI